MTQTLGNKILNSFIPYYKNVSIIANIKKQNSTKQIERFYWLY